MQAIQTKENHVTISNIRNYGLILTQTIEKHSKVIGFNLRDGIHQSAIIYSQRRVGHWCSVGSVQDMNATGAYMHKAMHNQDTTNTMRRVL